MLWLVTEHTNVGGFENRSSMSCTLQIIFLLVDLKHGGKDWGPLSFWYLTIANRCVLRLFLVGILIIISNNFKRLST